jgi:hypothetical protein
MRAIAYIEDGRIDLIPVVAHARGYLRTYAAAVEQGEDGVEIGDRAGADRRRHWTASIACHRARL